MKKYIYILTTVILFFLGGHNAYAINGACSYHYGVNCFAGVSSEGSVICNDGTSDSSVQYLDEVECKDVNHYCTLPELNQLKLTYRLRELSQQITDINTLLRQKSDLYNSKYPTNATLFMAGQSALEKQAASIEIQGLANQVLTAQSNYRIADVSVLNQCFQLGNIEYLQQQTQILKQEINSKSTTSEVVLPSPLTVIPLNVSTNLITGINTNNVIIKKKVLAVSPVVSPQTVTQNISIANNDNQKPALSSLKKFINWIKSIF
jgi:hypothetical protein